jgi:hypothetical protein
MPYKGINPQQVMLTQNVETMLIIMLTHEVLPLSMHIASRFIRDANANNAAMLNAMPTKQLKE